MELLSIYRLSGYRELMNEEVDRKAEREHGEHRTSTTEVAGTAGRQPRLRRTLTVYLQSSEHQFSETYQSHLI